VSGVFAAELLKLRTIRATWGYGLAAIVLGGLLAAASIGSSSDDDRLASDFQLDLVLGGAFPAVLLALLLGMLLFTNEFRHGTISRTLLVTPRRPLLVGLKLMVGAAAGIGLAVLAAATTVVVAVIWLGILDVPLEVGDAADAFWRSVLGVALIGALGAAVGGAVHSQVGALVGTLVWLFVAEPIVWVLLGLVDLDGIADYLPAVTVLSILDTEGENLSFGGTVGMAVVWTAVATLLAVLRTSRKDVT
jgi:ABC-2 type transport system permease protein